MTKSLVEQIKASIPFAPFVARRTNGLKRSSRDGAWYVGRCPFHQSSSDPPGKRKLWVNVERGLCGCFVPRCQAQAPGGKPMDLINFYARLKNINNGQAIDELAQLAGLKED